MGTRTHAWGIGLCLAAGVGACFNPPKDAGLTSSSLGCTPGTLECACTDQGTCESGLECTNGACVTVDDPTSTNGTTGGPPATTSEGATADDTTTPPGDTTVALDGTITGDATTGDATTGDATTGDASSSTGEPEPAVETVFFPTPSDFRFIAMDAVPWNGGDYFEGVRETVVPSVSQLDVHIPIIQNGLSECGFQEAAVILNGVWLGTFVIAQGTAVIDASFPAPSVVGPQYVIRYETVATVAFGCGAAGYDEISSTVTLWE